DSGVEGDFEGSDDEEEPRPRLSLRYMRFVRMHIEEMYSSRYEMPRNRAHRGPSYLPHVLNVLKHERPDEFRKELRVSPRTFDRLVERLIQDPVFSNSSQNEQMPVEDQVAITLFRFGHFGNGASITRVSRWAGYATGTVALATRRVMTAVLRQDFMRSVVRLPTAAEKREAKKWVAKHSVPGWRNGWCLVDGTLVPLYDRPFWYGQSYFDRKKNYSLNIQIVSLPNLRIIDFSYGDTGAIHDSMAFQETRLYREREDILDDGEFIWGDSAYTVRTHGHYLHIQF
ncbi:hypothetical protein DENSPDRAFT_789902, partial [Dentipellis sp. KUC8613]